MKKTIFLIFFLAILLAGCTNGKDSNSVKTIGLDEAKAKVNDYVNSKYGQGGKVQFNISSIEDVGSVYKVRVEVPNGEVDSYVSKDGKYFFIEGEDMTTEEETVASNEPKPNPKQPEPQITKSKKPKVEVFVMSHCPYGTQIEKGILPVAEALGDKIDLEIKFCDYAMHGEIELDEQLNQYCIQKEEPNKYLTYLECFLDQGVTTGCKAKAQINEDKNSACIAKTDKEYQVKELFADKSTWRGGRYPQFNVFQKDNQKYGISGSPALVINGDKVESSRDSGNLLVAVCAGFEEKPEECSKELSFLNPSPGFGYGQSTTGASGSCD